MNRIFTSLLLCLTVSLATAQTKPVTQPFGKVDAADLESKSCDFEKDANAEILFDKAEIYYDANLDLAMERHKRVKIYNTNGKDNANIRIEYISGNHVEFVTGLQAQTINMVNGKPEITKLDKKLIFTEHIDKSRSALVFTMPNVKEGSIIEYKYVWNTASLSNFPDWYFQDKLPTRYSEVTTAIPDFLEFRLKANITQQLVVNSRKDEGRSMGTGTNMIPYTLEKQTRGMANVPSLNDEPYMTATNDNLQSMVYQLTSVKPIMGFIKSYSDTWAKVGGILADDEDFGMQLKRKLTGEETIIAKAKGLATDDEKIRYIFGEVKNSMKWDGVDRWYTNDGTVKAWDKKTGNSAEINLILFHLLKQAGVKAYPMVVSTRDHGKVVPYYTFLYQFNRAVVYVPIDSARTYVLDATNKYNIYNQLPDNLLNSDALYIDKEKKQYDMVYLQRKDPIRQIVVIQGDVKSDGKMSGTAQISSFGYNRIHTMSRYKTDGEQKYTDYLRENNNNLKVTSLKFDNMEIDTLPLTQNVNFNLDLTSSDENYIYFVPNIFSSMRTNPFLSENRRTDIEFGYRNSYAIMGTYKLPANYKVDALPKSASMSMPDGSITFKRYVASENGVLMVRYVIDHKNTLYRKESYADFHEFYKKMYEMLNEQVVLKKS